MTDYIEKVALDADAADDIANRIARSMAVNGPPGVVPKQSDGPVFYGGHDRYTLAGKSDGQLATSLWLAKGLIEAERDRAGRIEHPASPRLVEVMTKAAANAVKAPGTYADPFIGEMYGGMLDDVRTKALTSTGAGTGDEWVPTFATADLWRDVHLETVAAQAVQRVTMPTNPYDLPVLSADPVFRYASSENVAVTASDPTTAKATLTAKKIQAEIDFSGEVTEDSVVPLAAALRAALVRRAAQTIDDLIVSGDTTSGATGNVNSDDTTPAAGTFYLALDGMRKFCITTNTGQAKSYAGAPTTTLMLSQRALMGKYGARASDLAWIVPASTTYALQDIAALQTLEKYGPQATIATGEVGRLFGSPVFLYEAIPGATTDKVDADGKYTTTTPASNDTKGWMVLVNRTGWTAGFRRDVVVETFRDIQKDSNILVCSFRMALIPSGISTQHTSIGYNLTI